MCPPLTIVASTSRWYLYFGWLKDTPGLEKRYIWYEEKGQTQTHYTE